jgi:hypothetical protein
MLTQLELINLGTKYLNELKARGRQFNPIKFKLKTRKSAGNYGIAYVTFKRLGYDQIEINQYLTDKKELINTILHELAHLDLEAYKDGHGADWKRVAAMYGRWYNTKITRTSNKTLEIPGMIEIHVVWSDKCLKVNKKLNRHYVKKVTSEKRASNFIKEYSSIGFIDSYKIVRL